MPRKVVVWVIAGVPPEDTRNTGVCAQMLGSVQAMRFAHVQDDTPPQLIRQVGLNISRDDCDEVLSAVAGAPDAKHISFVEFALALAKCSKVDFTKEEVILAFDVLSGRNERENGGGEVQVPTIEAQYLVNALEAPVTRRRRGVPVGRRKGVLVKRLAHLAAEGARGVEHLQRLPNDESSRGS